MYKMFDQQSISFCNRGKFSPYRSVVQCPAIQMHVVINSLKIRSPYYVLDKTSSFCFVDEECLYLNSSLSTIRNLKIPPFLLWGFRTWIMKNNKPDLPVTIILWYDQSKENTSIFRPVKEFSEECGLCQYNGEYWIRDLALYFAWSGGGVWVSGGTWLSGGTEGGSVVANRV